MVLALSLAACSGSLFGPPQPAVIKSLVAAAPAGSTVSVEHKDKSPWGAYDAHWSVDVRGVTVGVARDAYQAWCEASPTGWTWGLDPGGGYRCSDVEFWEPNRDEDWFRAKLSDDSPLAR